MEKNTVIFVNSPFLKDFFWIIHRCTRAASHISRFSWIYIFLPDGSWEIQNFSGFSGHSAEEKLWPHCRHLGNLQCAYGTHSAEVTRPFAGAGDIFRSCCICAVCNDNTYINSCVGNPGCQNTSTLTWHWVVCLFVCFTDTKETQTVMETFISTV